MTPRAAERSLPTFVVLLRGINVGGASSLRMSDLQAALKGLGCQSVRTYIQSGNAMFRAPASARADLQQRIAARLLRTHGVRTTVLLLTARDLERAITANPFPKAESSPKSLHLFFLAATPRRPNLTFLEEVRTSTERFQIKGRVFYLHAPEGVGRSKLATRVERALGVPATARNWRTCRKLLEIARSVAADDG